MLLLKAVQHPKVRLLWLGQVCSAMGDEIYRVAFVWLSVQMIGANTGYLASAQLAAALFSSIFGVWLIEHLHSEQAMVTLDLYRAGIVLIPVVLYLCHIPSFVTLAITALFLSGLGALFEPAVMETIPKVANEKELLKATNGLMATTNRLARVLGPIVVGTLSKFIPMIHFFTVDALTFVASIFSLRKVRIPAELAKTRSRVTWKSSVQSVSATMKMVRKEPSVFRTLMAKSVMAGAWGLCYGLGLALLANELDPGNVTTFGTIMSAYGIGNIFGVIVIGNLQRREPEKMVYHGLMWLGVFFFLIALTHHFLLILLFISLSAIGGPWNDLPFADLVQTHFPNQVIAKVYRLRNILDNLAQLTMMIISPVLFKFLHVQGTLVASAIIMFGCGLFGEFSRRRAQKA